MGVGVVYSQKFSELVYCTCGMVWIYDSELNTQFYSRIQEQHFYVGFRLLFLLVALFPVKSSTCTVKGSC